MGNRFELDPNWERQKVESTQIKEVAWNSKDKRVYVVFWNNSIYSYPGTYEDYNNLANAKSVGSHHRKHFRNRVTTKMRNGS